MVTVGDKLFKPGHKFFQLNTITGVLTEVEHEPYVDEETGEERMRIAPQENCVYLQAKNREDAIIYFKSLANKQTPDT